MSGPKVQASDGGNFRERSPLYRARAFSPSLKAGDPFSALPSAVGVNILGFKLLERSERESRFMILKPSRRALLTELLQIHFFELTKLLETASPDDKASLWLAFFPSMPSADRERIASLEGKIMTGANRSLDEAISWPLSQDLTSSREAP